MADSDHWFGPDLGTVTAVRTFAVPPPAAGAAFFRPWAENQPGGISLRAVRLPGREQRMRDAPYADLPAAATALATAIREQELERVALLGYCAGVWLALETARRLSPPTEVVAVYLVGTPVPEVLEPPPQDELTASGVTEWLAVAGADPRVLANPGVMRLIEPALRADLAMLQGYRIPETPLSVPIVHVGPGDTVVDETGWTAHTDAGFSTIEVTGGPADVGLRVVAAVAADLAQRMT
jgi:surfactin synthase thioesterase subunit